MFKFIAATVILSAIADLAFCQCPTIISRAAWGARPPTGTTGLSVFPPSHTVVHHAETPACTTQADCIARVQSIQNYHMDSNGWNDIGYNFLVGEDGNVYEGRGWGITGAHTVGYNSMSIGICMIGNFMTIAPNSAALSAAQQLISCGVSMGEISSSYLLMGHRQGDSTDCPGDTLYGIIQGWPHWTATP